MEKITNSNIRVATSRTGDTVTLDITFVKYPPKMEVSQTINISRPGWATFTTYGRESFYILKDALEEALKSLDSYTIKKQPEEILLKSGIIKE